jgi:hypothetical protein
MGNPTADKTEKTWRSAVLYALPPVALLLALFVYWFGLADRYTVFLYYHDMGPIVPDTTPFSRVTGSRYWMAGLVADGAILVLNVAFNWLMGQLRSGYRPPTWRRVWLAAAMPLLVGLPLITLTLNEPVLPWGLALWVTAVTLIGLAVALLPGRWAAARPLSLLFLASDGLGLAMLLLTMPSLERFPRWLADHSYGYMVMTLILLVLGVGWLLFMTLLYWWRRRPVPSVVELGLGGTAVAYLLMPLVHHILGTDGYFYISDSDNFFAMTVWMQSIIWLTTFAIVWLLTRWRINLANRRNRVLN